MGPSSESKTIMSTRATAHHDHQMLRTHNPRIGQMMRPDHRSLIAWMRFVAKGHTTVKASRFRLSLQSQYFYLVSVEVRFFKQKIGHTKVIVVYSWLLRLIVHVKINLRSCIRCHWIARNLIFHFLKTWIQRRQLIELRAKKTLQQSISNNIFARYPSVALARNI